MESIELAKVNTKLKKEDLELKNKSTSLKANFDELSKTLPKELDKKNTLVESIFKEKFND